MWKDKNPTSFLSHKGLVMGSVLNVKSGISVKPTHEKPAEEGSNGSAHNVKSAGNIHSLKPSAKGETS